MIKLGKVLAWGITLVILFSCSERHPTLPSPPPGTVLFSEDKIPLAEGEYLYRQTISLCQPADDLYSWRLTTWNGELPDGLAANDDGWLWFRAPGADPSIPLNQPGAHRTLWTSSSSLSCDFPSQAGQIHNFVTRATARIKTSDGSVTEHVAPCKTDRLINSTITVPFGDGDTTSTGIEFGLNEVIGDIFVEGLFADHFMYRLNIIDADTQAIITAGQWHSSLSSPDLRRVRLTSNTVPAINVNSSGTLTQFESYVVSRQGVEEATHNTVYFNAQQGFRPRALIYPQCLAALGQYHYSWIHSELPSEFYELIPPQQGNFLHQLWETDTGYQAVHSADLKLHLQWGYHGQYGVLAANGQTVITNYPWDKELNMCLDDATGSSYGSAVVAFDLRLNSAPFPALDQFLDPSVITHSDGSQWLRVQNLNALSRHCVLENLPPGELLFEACAVDVQGTYSDPASVTVSLVPYIPEASRSGILIVDDDRANVSVSPEPWVYDFYVSTVPMNWGGVNTVMAFDTDTFQPLPVSMATLQNYKAVVWHMDNPSDPGRLYYSLAALEIYLAHQGKLVVSGTHNLASALNNAVNEAPGFSSSRLGITGEYQFGILSSALQTRPFFVQAEGLNGLDDIDLNLTSAFNPLVMNRQGLATVSYFNPGTGLDFLYQFGCKPVSAPVAPPTQEQYDLYSSKFVGCRHDQNGASAVLLGFPLSYMEQNDVQIALQDLLGDMLGGSLARGGGK